MPRAKCRAHSLTNYKLNVCLFLNIMVHRLIPWTFVVSNLKILQCIWKLWPRQENPDGQRDACTDIKKPSWWLCPAYRKRAWPKTKITRLLNIVKTKANTLIMPMVDLYLQWRVGSQCQHVSAQSSHAPPSVPRSSSFLWKSYPPLSPRGPASWVYLSDGNQQNQRHLWSEIYN